MEKVKSKILAGLFAELRFAPVRQKEKQLFAARELVRIAEPNREYPLEFIIFRITGYRPGTDVSGRMIKGDDLARDLGIFITRLDLQLASSAAEQGQKIYSTAELAGKLSVCGKTIRRWQKKGLAGRIYIFADGVKKTGFTESDIEAFLRDNKELVAGAGRFCRLTDRQRQQIIEHAVEIHSARPDLSRYHVILKIKEITGRSPETIRCVLTEYEKNNPDRHIFSKPPGAMTTRDAAVIYSLYCQGSKIGDLMKKFSRSRSSIYRIINRRKARRILEADINYIDSPEFLQPDAEQTITAVPTPVAAGGHNESLRLTATEESELFRRYNYLKYLACLVRAGLSGITPAGRVLRLIEGYLAEAEKIKKILIEANLPLVVSVATRHSMTGTNISDLVSEGSLSLMRAVENFDYTRGYRFSTYATWAITKDYARSIPAEAARLDRHISTDMSNISAGMAAEDIVQLAAIDDAHRSLVQVIKENLSEREQYVILNHFALEPGPVKRKPQTLKQIGDHLGISKERVRQVELAALQKLRQRLSPEQFEMLKG